MCWQCITPPWIYLPEAKLVIPPQGDGYSPVTIEWMGEMFTTNEDADWQFCHQALPGDMDSDGIQFFIATPHKGKEKEP